MGERLQFNLPAAVPFGESGLQEPSVARLVERLRMVLETRPGHLPWQPEFGCSLDDLVGEPLTSLNLGSARSRIQDAIQRWMPEVELVSASLEVINDWETAGTGRPRSLPMAEAAMVPFGVGGSLLVSLQIESQFGPVSLRLTLPE